MNEIRTYLSRSILKEASFVADDSTWSRLQYK